MLKFKKNKLCRKRKLCSDYYCTKWSRVLNASQRKMVDL